MRQAGAEAAYDLVDRKSAGEIWMECFTAALMALGSGLYGVENPTPTAIKVADWAYEAILNRAKEHRDSLVVR